MIIRAWFWLGLLIWNPLHFPIQWISFGWVLFVIGFVLLVIKALLVWKIIAGANPTVEWWTND